MWGGFACFIHNAPNIYTHQGTCYSTLIILVNPAIFETRLVFCPRGKKRIFKTRQMEIYRHVNTPQRLRTQTNGNIPPRQYIATAVHTHKWQYTATSIHRNGCPHTSINSNKHCNMDLVAGGSEMSVKNKCQK